MPLAFSSSVPDEEELPQTEVAEEPEITPAKGKTKLVILVVAVLIVVGGGLAVRHVLHSPAAKAVDRVPAQEPEPIKATLHLETFVINLSDIDEKAYLRVGIDLGLAHEVEVKEGSSTTPVPRVRDVIIGVLSVCSADQLLTAEGKSKLKNDLLAALREGAPELGVREVYFTEFLVQR